jgi:membrane protein YqaA with SNARE-associated domain
MHFLHQVSDALIRFGPWGVLLLSLLDSLGVPMPAAMDALLIYVAWKSPERAWFTAAMAVAGSIAGNCGLFFGARHGIRRFMKPPPEPGQPQKFRAWFRRYGLVTVFIPALLPIPLPLKVFVISAGVLHTPVSHFVGVIVLARCIRFFSEAYLGMRLGQDAQAFLNHNAWTLIGIALSLALVLFWVIRLGDRRRSRDVLPDGRTLQ